MSETQVPRRKALSATSTSTWKQCQLKFRLLYIDGFREPPNPVTARGTLVHSVLEHLFDYSPTLRTPETARTLTQQQFQQDFSTDPQFQSMFNDESALNQWLAEVDSLVESYFQVENPQRLEPFEREMLVDAQTNSGIAIRGFIDRVDKAANGAIRIVDYKTGKAPRPQYLEDKLHQMRFYSLLMRQAGHGVPARTQLVFLGDGKTLTFDPQPQQVAAFEYYLEEIWQQIKQACHTQNFTPRRQPLCNWCGVKQYCPVYGNETPQLPEDGIQQLLTIGD